MMEHVWADVYERAVEAFGGQTPGAQLEASIVERFEQTPQVVVSAVDKLGARFAAGKVHSPWPLVLRECDQAPARESIVASDDSEQEHKRVKAERFIRQVGYICETEAELRGELEERKWPVTDDLIALWRTVRPIGERLERETLERAEHWKQTRKKLASSTSASDKPLHSSHSEMHGTAVPCTSDVDADLVWT